MKKGVSLISKDMAAVLLVVLPCILSSCVAAAPYLVTAGASAVSGAVAANKIKEKGPQKSQLEIRELQTRTYDIRDSKIVLKTMLNVLQDDGFIITEANTDLGLLSASKEMDVQTKGAVFWGTMFGGTWDKNSIVEATANVSEFGKQTRVRINFQQTVHNSSGGVARVEVIEEPQFYQEFFSKVDKGLFIQQENL